MFADFASMQRLDTIHMRFCLKYLLEASMDEPNAMRQSAPWMSRLQIVPLKPGCDL